MRVNTTGHAFTWSEKVTESLNEKPAADETIYINSLEFVVVILQYVETAVLLETLPESVAGQTLLCKNFQDDNGQTIRRAAATLSALFGENTRDYRKNYANDTTISNTLTSVYNELARWESVPNRREPFTLKMLIYI